MIREDHLKNGVFKYFFFQKNTDKKLWRVGVIFSKPWVRWKSWDDNNFLYIRRSFNPKITEFRLWRVQVGCKVL